jgi:murein peptide amidase A
MPTRSRLARIAAFAALVLTVCWLEAGALDAAAASKRLTIGHSVRGRPITATVIGDPDAADRFLVFGCVHGNEPAGIRVARRLIASGRSGDAAFWIVPSLNPDGVAAGTRGNAHGVDLNRNFPFAWRPLGGLEYSGHRPLSEPESRAAHRLIRRIEPDVTIWFHQPFDLVDRSGGDAAIERRYAELVGRPLVRLPPHPGTATSWQTHALPRSTAFVVELPAAVSGDLIRLATTAVTTLANEYASAHIGNSEPAAQGPTATVDRSGLADSPPERFRFLRVPPGA